MPQISFATKELQPPTVFWVTPDDYLVVGIRNSLVGVNVSVQTRILTIDGQIINPNFTAVPPSDRTLNYFNTVLTYGWLLSAVAFASGPTLPIRGQTYVSIQVAQTPNQLLSRSLGMAAGYLAGNQFVEWPYGRIVDAVEGPGAFIVGLFTSPAAGTEFDILVNSNARWKIRSVRATLTTSAVVNVRVPTLRFRTPGTTLFDLDTPVGQSAGQSFPFSWVQGFPQVAAPTAANTNFIPADIEMLAGWHVTSVTKNLDVGDQWSSIVAFIEEFLED